MKKTFFSIFCMAFIAVLCIGNLNAQMLRTQEGGKQAVAATQFSNANSFTVTPNVPRAPKGMVNVTLTNPYDVWGYGEGYQLLLDETATQYGLAIPVEGRFCYCYEITPNMYDVFSHTIPAGAYPACATAASQPGNWVFCNSVTIQIPAGTYDWCVVNPEVGNALWIVGVNGRYDNYVFQDGKKYTFTITGDGMNEDINTITIEDDGEMCDPITNLAATIQGTDVKLTWTAAPGSPTGYKVYDGTTSLATVTETEYMAKNLSDGIHTLGIEAIYTDDCTPVKVTKDVTIKSGNPITNLDGNCAGGTLTLTWDAPEAKGNRDDISLQYCSDYINDGIGVSGSPFELWPGIRYTPSDLATLGVETGMELTKVGFMPYATPCTFTLKVYQGGDWTTKNPGTEKVSQLVTSTVTAQVWNDITLNNPVTIDASQELWIVVQVVSSGPAGPGVDAGPIVAPAKSNICYDATFTFVWCVSTDLLSSFTYNWMVRGFASGEAGVIELSNYDIYQDDTHFGEAAADATSFTKTGVEGEHNYCVVAVYDNNAQSQKVCKMIECGSPCEPITNPEGTLDLTTANITWTAVEGATKYEVTRDGKTETVTTNAYTETGEFVGGETYTWEIVTVCADGKSEPVQVPLICNSINDIALSLFTIVPNPAQNEITISAGVAFNTVEVINFLGQTVIFQTNNAETVKLDISNLNSGVYFVRLVSENGTSVKKFVKQ